MTDKPLDDVWHSRDLPVLVEVTRRIDNGDPGVVPETIAKSLDISTDDVHRAGSALARRRLVDVMKTAGDKVMVFKDVSAEAYTLTGLWPDPETLTNQLLATLDERIDRTDDPDTRGRLQKVRGSLKELPRSVLVSLIGSLGSGTILGL